MPFDPFNPVRVLLENFETRLAYQEARPPIEVEVPVPVPTPTPVPTPPPAPTFAAQPSIVPDSGAVGTRFGVASVGLNATTRTIQWYLNGTALSGETGPTLLSANVGNLFARVTLNGPSGTATADTPVVAVTAATTPTPTPAPVPTLSLSSALVQSEAQTTFTYTLTLLRDGSTAAFPFSWNVVGSGSNPANADDFGGTMPSGNGSFAPGESVKSIVITLTNDATAEPNEGFTLTVTAAGLNTVSATGTISNDDIAGPGELTYSAALGKPVLGVMPGKAGVFPPDLYVDLPLEPQTDVTNYRLQRTAIGDSGFAAVVQQYLAPITNADAVDGEIDGVLGAVTDPGLYRMRLETATNFGDWSDPIAHGDVAAPVLTSSTSFSGNENAKMAVGVTYNETVNLTLGGADAPLLELVPAGLSANYTVRLKDDAFLNTEVKASYAWTLIATDLAGNVGPSTPFTFTATNEADLPTQPSVSPILSGATPNTVYTSNTFTVAGMGPGVVNQAGRVSAGGSYSKNGGPYTSAPFSFQNGDTFAIQLTTAAGASATTQATLFLDTVAAEYTVRAGAGATTLDATRKTPAVTLSNGGLTASRNASVSGAFEVMASTAVPLNTGKYYLEIDLTYVWNSEDHTVFGVGDANFTFGAESITETPDGGVLFNKLNGEAGFAGYQNNYPASGGAFSGQDPFGIVIDTDAKRIEVYDNNGFMGGLTMPTLVGEMRFFMNMFGPGFEAGGSLNAKFTRPFQLPTSVVNHANLQPYGV